MCFMYKRKKSPCMSEFRWLLLTKPSLSLYWKKNCYCFSCFCGPIFCLASCKSYGGLCFFGKCKLAKPEPRVTGRGNSVQKFLFPHQYKCWLQIAIKPVIWQSSRLTLLGSQEELYTGQIPFVHIMDQWKKIVCKETDDNLMDKISAIISDDAYSSCITCQIPGDIVFSRASSILLV